MTLKKRPLGDRLPALYRRWPWIAALVLVLHLAVLLGLDRILLGLISPREDDSGPMAVQMLPPPTMPVFPVVPPAPAPVPPAIVSESDLAAATPPESVPDQKSSDSPLSAGQSPDLASRIPTDSELPKVGGVALSAFWGDHTSGTQIGRGSIQLNFTPDGRYNIKLVTEAVGWATIFASKPLYAETVGTIGPGGLRPERHTHRSPRGKEEVSIFDYEKKKITYSSLKEPLPLLNGIQDRLSFMIQLAWMMKVAPERFSLGETIDLPMAGRNKVEEVTFWVESDADVVMPGGVLVPAVHLSSHRAGERFKGKIDIWLDRTDRLLPVRIRFEEARGQVLDLLTVRQP
ncbi:DUF3108 domain-containing protein [beta proteobacterium MWH-UniP1]